MAKRKSTQKSSSKGQDTSTDTPEVAETPEQSDATPTDVEIANDAVEAVDTYAPAEDASLEKKETADISDEAIETPEPTDADGPDDKNSDAAKTDTATSETDADAGKDDADDADVTDASEEKALTDDAEKPAETEWNPDDHISEEDAARLLEEAETAEPHDTEPVFEEEPKLASPQPEFIKETVVEKKGGFVPMLLGGAVAAVLGYGAAAYVSQDVWPFNAAEDNGFEAEIRDALSAQSGTVSDLSDRLTALEGAEPPTVDLSPVENGLSAVQGTVSDLSGQLDNIVARIDALERQPLEQAVSPEAIEAYERALAELQAEVEAQRAEVAQMAQEAIQAEGNAEEQAQLAASRAALADITTALDTGSAYADAVAVLSANGVDVPDALGANADNGIATLGALIDGFPNAARAALSAARSSETDNAEGTNRLATFFANQLGARSVAPREGDDPDAILSRTEAALRSGDLATALSEVSALPETAQAALADWQASAQTRLEAKTAADALVQQLLQE
ncbi:mitofilin family membrane protein [Marivita hallyeonensis]|uniref:Inner membrane protein n=1 Tax=Marivita hallyeonensis TaxID=996342 RepID=A0A1M5U5K9_9RHOB|nr:mitofilin family membrane protein [Marivita hallyeonensis]SHH58239.1 hypothetical protein SAMN05443551_2497 [Marivita hallyeonensis]